LGLVDTLRLSLSAVALVVCFVLRHLLKPSLPQKQKRLKSLTMAGMLASGWYFVGSLLNWLSGRSGIGLHIEDFEMFSDRVMIAGVSVARTTVLMYIVLGIVAVLLLAFRLLAVPNFDRDHPTGIQNAVEALVELADNYVRSIVGDGLGDGISCYMFAVGVILLSFAFTEIFGQRAPTSDLTVTFSLALVTFFLINFYGIRKKGLGGRIKSLASPSPMIFPMKILSDCAVPVSLACRLFGNMLGGYIVMDLLKASLGGYSSGISAAAGLFFNLFHPAIQTYIFITLSLTFINEAAE